MSKGVRVQISPGVQIVFVFIEKAMEELEDIFKTKEFKELPFVKRIWIRIKIAIIQTLNSW